MSKKDYKHVKHELKKLGLEGDYEVIKNGTIFVKNNKDKKIVEKFLTDKPYHYNVQVRKKEREGKNYKRQNKQILETGFYINKSLNDEEIDYDNLSQTTTKFPVDYETIDSKVDDTQQEINSNKEDNEEIVVYGQTVDLSKGGYQIKEYPTDEEKKKEELMELLRSQERNLEQIGNNDYNIEKTIKEQTLTTDEQIKKMENGIFPDDFEEFFNE